MSVCGLGEAQTDFARNFAKEGFGLLEMLADVALADADVDDAQVPVAHVGGQHPARRCVLIRKRGRPRRVR